MTAAVKFPALAIAAGLAVLAVAACQDLPQPFRHHGPPPPLTRPQEARAVAVQPVDASPAARAMAAALVKALTDREIPAVIGPAAPGALLLHGTMTAADGRVELAWVLDGPDHKPKATTRQTMAAAAWRQATPPALQSVAERAVAALTGDSGAAPAAAHRPTVRLQPPAAPGDGGAALARAMRNALERSGILVVGEGGDYLVDAKVTVSPGRPGEQVLAVAWVVHGKDGKALATINQNGTVASGRLEQPWGTLARQIAEGGAAGITQVIQTTGPAP